MGSFFLNSGFKVTGCSNLKNAKIQFHNIDSGEIYNIVSSNDGDIKTKLKKGSYKVCSKDSRAQKKYNNPETTPIKLEVQNDINIRVEIK